MPTIQCCSCFKFCVANIQQGTHNKIKTHSIFKCPYNGCGKMFYYYICPFCKRDFNHSVFLRINMTCPFKDCRKVFTYFSCKKCQYDNFIPAATWGAQMEIEEYFCQYCQEKNDVNDVPNLFNFVNLMKANIKQGEAFPFDDPEEDPYDRQIINSLVPSMIYDIPIPQKNMVSYSDNFSGDMSKCVVCLEKERISVFAPCGHRCVCLECGKKICQKMKKCPICKENITGFLERVIDD